MVAEVDSCEMSTSGWTLQYATPQACKPGSNASPADDVSELRTRCDTTNIARWQMLKVVVVWVAPPLNLALQPNFLCSFGCVWVAFCEIRFLGGRP